MQGNAPTSDAIRDGNVYSDDPGGDGVILFENGVTGYMLHTGRYEYLVNCERGAVGTINDTLGFFIRREADAPRSLKEVEYPHFEMSSPTVNLIDDLARALDTGAPPLGGMESARHGVEIMAAMLESHLRGGERIAMPLEESDLRMHRVNRDPWEKGPRWREPKLAL